MRFCIICGEPFEAHNLCMDCGNCFDCCDCTIDGIPPRYKHEGEDYLRDEVE